MHKYVLCLRADISILVMCDASDVIEYARRRSELSVYAPLHTKLDTTSIDI